MNINPIQFNFIQSKPQKTANRPMLMNNGLKADTVSFSGNINEEDTTSIDRDFWGIAKLKKLEPKHKGIVYKKVCDENGKVIQKIPVEVDIVKTSPDVFSFIIDGEYRGFVELSYVSDEHRKEDKDCKYRNYKDEGIKGDRVIVEYLKNDCGNTYCGMGHLADLLEVAVCKELGIEPNVVSESTRSAAPLHYMRGKRFVPYKKYLSRYDRKSMDVYGKSPNETIKKIIENTHEGEKFDTSEIKNTPLMYMPKEMIQELEEELKEHPIF